MTGQDIVSRTLELGKKCVYWYGAKRQLPSMALAAKLRKDNPRVWTSEYFEAATADVGKGKFVCDCSGLVCNSRYRYESVSEEIRGVHRNQLYSGNDRMEKRSLWYHFGFARYYRRNARVKMGFLYREKIPGCRIYQNILLSQSYICRVR